MLHCSALWQFFYIFAHKAERFSALLPTMQKNILGCCLRCQSFFRVVGNNEENRSNFSSCWFSSVVAYNASNFSALRTTAQKTDGCCLHCEKTVGIVGNNAENGRI
jgi:hypothetical protein